MKMNIRKMKFSVFFLIAAAAVSGFAQQIEDKLSSPLAAEAFYQAGHEIYTDKQAGLSEANQAMLLFNAAINLDSTTDYIPPEIINLAWEFPEGDFSEAVKFALDKYVGIGRTSDLEVAAKAVKYLLERLGSREEREQLLQELMDKYGEKSQFFVSELATQMAFLKAETADSAELQRYLMYAYTANKFNFLAFDKLAELADSGGEKLDDFMYLQDMRWRVRVNPLDLQAALNFSRLAETLGLYTPAAAGYRYCTQVYSYLNPSGAMPLQFYRPWMLNCYNMRDYRTCKEILASVRNAGLFDVMIEAIAGTSAKQSGDPQGGQNIFDGIKSRGDKILTGQVKSSPDEIQEFTWFYCFVNDSNAQDMLAWATKACEADNNSVNAKSFLSYALVKNGQIELAKPMLEKIGESTQIAAIAKAEILVADNNNSAVEILKSAVSAAPGTFEAQKGKAMLKQLGSEYLPPIEADTVVTMMQNDLGQTFFSEFIAPEKMIKISLQTSGMAFSYGSEINAQLAIINNNSEPLIVCKDGLFKGNVRVDVRVSGNLTERIDNFITKTVRPSYEIRPGQALFIPLQLLSGRLKTILESYPQADLNLEITVYTDPHIGSDGQIQNFFGTKPVVTIIKRRKLNLDTHYLQQKFDTLKNGQQGQKIKSAELFAGLLTEQQKLSQLGTKYRFVYAEPGLFTSAIASCLTGDDWILKVKTIAALQKIKLDYRLIESVSNQLEDKFWPVRLMSICVLAQKQKESFLPVLSWVNKNDTEQVVKDLAMELAGGRIKVEKTVDSNSH